VRFLLDTNVCIDVLRGRDEVVAHFRKHAPADLLVSAVTVFELVQGAGRAPIAHRASEDRKISTFLSAIPSVEFDRSCARIAGDINAALLNSGTPVGILDVFIAATALVMDLPLVTSNTRDFFKIEGLELIDWLEDNEA
jgi:tRNA(fMet)-specific endonuclease VapC